MDDQLVKILLDNNYKTYQYCSKKKVTEEKKKTISFDLSQKFLS
jgi:hypothetical protein